MPFGRNVLLEHTYPENSWSIRNEPNPRTVSRVLLTRDTFKPATTLNLMAAVRHANPTHIPGRTLSERYLAAHLYQY